MRKHFALSQSIDCVKSCWMIGGVARWLGYLLIMAAARAEIPPDYYKVAERKSGEELRQALHIIIRGHQVIPYSDSSKPDTSDALMELDQDSAETNNVPLIYSGVSMPKRYFGTTDGWNREHLWPNSYGLDDREPAFSDLHNLRAVDATVNSSRGNKFFDRSDLSDPGFRAPGHSEAPKTSTDSDSWEPPNDVKGDIARALFYMAVRYTGEEAGEPALFITDRTKEVLSTTNLIARRTILLIWNVADPVDDRERLRNDLVFAHYQRNRNPFVDHPEWALDVFGPRFQIARIDGKITVAWQTEFTLPTPETATTPGGPWASVTNAEIISGERLRWPLSFSNEALFFRLIAQ